MDYVILGKNIRKYRQMRGLRQEDLAEICDCGNSHIGQIENARGIPSLDMIVRIANALSVTVDQLLRGIIRNLRRSICERLRNVLRSIR